MTRRMPLIAALCALLCLIAAAPAAASNRDRIIQDCADDGRLQGRYSASELRDARQNLPSDVAEYTDCADVLRRAELPDRGSGGGSAGGSGTGTGGSGFSAASGGGTSELLTPSSPDEARKLAQVEQSGGQAVDVGGEQIVPGASGLAPDAARNSVPTTLLVALLALALLAVAAAVPLLRRGVPWDRLPPWRRVA